MNKVLARTQVKVRAARV